MTEKVSFFKRMKKYFKGVLAELKKVTWPTRKELLNYTAIVVAMTVIIAAALGLFDLVFRELILSYI